MGDNASTSSLRNLRSRYDAGKIDRTEFWNEMRTRHATLRSYQELLRAGCAEAIEISEAGLIVRLRTGQRYFWNPDHVRGPCSIAINHGDYEPDVRRVLLTCAQNADVVADIGANIGWYSIQLASVIARGGRILAFEPTPTTAAALHDNVALNGLTDTVEVVAKGLSEQPGAATLYLPDASGPVAASLRDLHPSERNSMIEVALSTLEAEMQDRKIRHLDLIKCDVEGAELMVLRGAKNIIERDRPLLLLEMLRKWSAAFDYHPNDILSWVGELDYACWAISESGLRHVSAVDDATAETNFLFAVPDRHSGVLATLGAELP